jgi:predicted metal-dependent peptidase
MQRTTQTVQSLNSQPDHISMQTAGIMSGCSYSHAFFSAYLYTRQRVQTVMPDNALSTIIKTAATDGRYIWLNEAFMASHAPAERIGVLCHEVSHDQFDHPGQTKFFREQGFVPAPSDGRPLQFDHKRANIAQDAVINRMLLQSGIALPANRIEFPWVTDDMSWLDVYEKLDEQGGEGGGGKGKGQPGDEGDDGDHGGFDMHIEPDTAETEADKEARKHALAEAISAGEKAGNVPANMKRWLDKLRESHIPWTQVLADLLVRVAGQDSLDWHRIHRRQYLLTTAITPRRKSEHCPPIVFMVDVSGSTMPYIQQFLGEVGAVAEEMSPKAIHVIWCDTRVAGVDSIDDARAEDVKALTIRGGGGTDLRAGFQHLADDPDGVFEGDPAAFVILTDSETAWPSRDPGFPVICATTGPQLSHPAWMQVVPIDKKDARA